MKNKQQFVIAIAIASLTITSLNLPSSAQQTLTGGVEKDDLLKQAPTLTRSKDVPATTQDFPDGQEQTLDPPKAAFKDEKPQPPPRAPKTFGLQADQDDTLNGSPSFDLGAQQQARVPGFHSLPSGPPLAPQTPMQAPMMQQQPPQIAAVPPNFEPNDPDSTPDMMLAWDAWHHRVAQAIFERFELVAKSAFRRSGPLEARISYQVTRDHRIINMSMPEKSPNSLFNVAVYQAVKSLEGDAALLEFPQGSRRMVVYKPGTFQWNFGNDGFKYTTGDREVIPGVH
ncbi:MAG TPA: hypothetical protein V6D22_25730 [Candidatus Obscuribacterales bacterium]